MTNYFEFYGLPVTFHPDQNRVREQYYALSKKYHPDFYINESAEKQDEVLGLSTLNNKAFQVLRNRDKVLQYVLTLKGVLTEGENYVLPQSFLMEMIEVNEALMELSFSDDKTGLEDVKTQVAEIERSLNQQLEDLTLQYDNTSGDEDPVLLDAIKDVYFRNKYIARLKEKM